jgi:hypothetical protein
VDICLQNICGELLLPPGAGTDSLFSGDLLEVPPSPPYFAYRQYSCAFQRLQMRTARKASLFQIAYGQNLDNQALSSFFGGDGNTVPYCLRLDHVLLIPFWPQGQMSHGKTAGPSTPVGMTVCRVRLLSFSTFFTLAECGKNLPQMERTQRGMISSSARGE